MPASSTKARTRPAKESSRSQTVGAEARLAGVELTNADRVLYIDQGITKRGLASYYAEVADWILPHIAERPLSLVRCPGGQRKTCFYQKHAAAGMPRNLERISIREKEGNAEYLMVRDVAGLVALVQMGVLEIHPWGTRADNLERPDRLIFDLDPDAAVAWEQVVDTAFRLRDRLTGLGLTSFVKTTGGKGLHLYVPLQRRHDWDAVKAFARAVVAELERDAPQHYTTNSSKAARRGKIFLDYLRNDRGATAVAPYSTRAKAGATVSVPLGWDELSAAIRSDHFEITAVPGRLQALKADPWSGFFAVRQSLTAAARKAVGLSGR